MNNGWKFTINVPPMVFKDKIIVFNKGMRPRAEEPPSMLEYKYAIKDEIEMIIDNPFECDVELEMDFYMPTSRKSYPTSVAHLMAKCLVPPLIADPRQIKQVISRIHYPDDSKDYKARTELIVTPSL